MTWLDAEVKTVIGPAYALAAGGSRTVIGEEHLLVALLETPAGVAWLTPLTVTQVRDEIWPAVRSARLTGGLSATDRAALDGLGLDLPSLEQQLDSLGPGEVLQRAARPSGGWSQRMTDAAAVVLARAEDLAVARGSRAVGLRELVAALVEVPSLITEHLAERGITKDSVRLRQQDGDEQ